MGQSFLASKSENVMDHRANWHREQTSYSHDQNIFTLCWKSLIFLYCIKFQIDLYIPIIYLFQFIFYLGWIKAAEVMLNPFGEDDDDFEINYVLFG